MSGRQNGNYDRLPDHVFHALKEEARDRHNLSDVVSAFTDLRPVGRELVGLCPFHEERTPSFGVNDATGEYHCFGCGAGGDVFRFLMNKLGIGFADAFAWLAGQNLPTIDPSVRAKQRQEDREARLRDEADAVTFWGEAIDLPGTAGETYLREARGITMLDLPTSLRFGRLPAWRDKDTGEWGKRLPALVCGVFDRDGAVCGIQRVFLQEDGRGKADMRRTKMSLGRLRGASMRLGPPQPSIIVCEGPEDGVTLKQERPNNSVWPTLGTSLMASVEYPDVVREIVIAGQNDNAGRAAADKATEGLLARGYAVRSVFPDPQFKDWNDQLRGILL